MRQLTQRQSELLSYLKSSNEWIRGRQLAELLSVSDRTIRTEIGEIKRKISDDIILSSKKSGYKYNEEIEYQDEKIAYDFYSSTNRLIYICKVLTIKGSVLIDELLDTLHISETTLTVDLGKIKKKIDTYYALDLELVRIDGLIELHGKLEYKIDFLTAVMQTPQQSPKSLAPFFEEFDLIRLHEKIRELLVIYGIEIKYYSTLSFVILIAICMESSLEEEQQQNNDPVEELSFIEDICKYIYDEFTIVLSPAAKKMLQKKIIKLEENTKMEQHIHEQSMEKDSLYFDLLEILTEIKRVFFIDFTKDEQVIQDMTRHIKIALYRIRNGIDIKNVIREELMTENPLLLDIAIYIANRMYEKEGVLFNTEEISLLIVYLGAGYEKIHQVNEMKVHPQILLVVFEGQAVLRFLKNKIIEALDEQDYDFIDVTSIAQIEKIKKESKKIDLVITTSTRVFFEHTKTVVVEQSFSKMDTMTTKRELEQLRKELRNLKFQYIWDKYISLANVGENKYSNRYEAIISLSQELMKEGYFDDTYLASVLDRENLFTTGMANGIALPHPIKMNAFKSILEFSILDQQMDWGGMEVGVIIFFVLSQEDCKDLKLLSDFLSIISNHTESREKLRNVKTKKMLQEVLNYLYCNE